MHGRCWTSILATNRYWGISMNYKTAKKLAIEIVDDFSPLDITQNYGSAFDAKTLLDDIGLPAPVRAAMPPRTNKVFDALAKPWKLVGSVDCVKCTTIGAYIKLCCKNASVAIPAGEPT